MKVVIVHGSNTKDRENMVKYNLPPQNERDWIAWTKEKLEEKGIECITPLMPENWNPIYKNWKKEFEKIKISKEDVLIGWSSGGAFLVRWLGETKKEIKKLILVAPAIANELTGDWKPNNFHNFHIDKTLKNRIKEIILIESSNDSKDILRSSEIYSKELNSKPLILKNKGHFTGHIMGREFPELLEKILE